VNPVRLPLEPAWPEATFAGPIADRLRGNLEQWLLSAPGSNPAMLEMFRLRERTPRVPLVPWYGEFPGKYLASAALAWRIDRSDKLRAVADGVVDELAAAQSPEGYLGPHPRAERLSGSTEGEEGESLPWWRKRRKLWDVWGHYQVILGLLFWHEATGSAKALATAVAAADAIVERFLGRGAGILEAGESDKNTAVIHVLCLLFEKTGKPDYLAMARSIEASWDSPEAGGYLSAGLQGIPFHETRLPRWESLHAVQGIFELHRITGDTRYAQAYKSLWWSMLRYDRHNTGGFSSGEQARGNPYDPRPIETCCTVAFMAVSTDMLRLSGDPYVADELELSFYNGALGAQHPSGRWWTYNTPMDGVKKASAHDIVFQAIQGSPEINCCSVNGPRSLGMLAEWPLMRSAGGLTLNYYGPGTFTAALASGRRLAIRQRTRYPAGSTVTIALGMDEPERFELRLRIPGWSAKTRVTLNGKPVEGVVPGRYFSLDRTWADGDTIWLSLDLSLHFWVGDRECAEKVSLYRGPILLAWDQRFNDGDPGAIPVVEAGRLACSPEPVPRSVAAWPAPWVLVGLDGAGGGRLRLCDFATAGVTGSRYVTWLPCSGFTAAGFEPHRPEWFGRRDR
jgi:uncharacterized protein